MTDAIDASADEGQDTILPVPSHLRGFVSPEVLKSRARLLTRRAQMRTEDPDAFRRYMAVFAHAILYGRSQGGEAQALNSDTGATRDSGGEEVRASA